MCGPPPAARRQRAAATAGSRAELLLKWAAIGCGGGEEADGGPPHGAYRVGQAYTVRLGWLVDGAADLRVHDWAAQRPQNEGAQSGR